MTQTLVLHNYAGKAAEFEVNDVEDIMCGLYYTICGDECVCIIYGDGEFDVFDADEEFGLRRLSSAPEDMKVLMPGDFHWKREYDA